MAFEPNRGQTDGRVQFLSRGPGYTLFLTPGEALLSLRTSTNSPAEARAALRRHERLHSQIRETHFGMELRGANRQAKAEGIAQTGGTVNYFIGNQPSRWQSGIPTFQKVKYSAIYPGIDLVFYGNQRHLEYDFVVAPNAAPDKISLLFKGAQNLEITSSGDLAAHLEGGIVQWKKPFAYQEIGANRQEVAASFVLRSDGSVGFNFGPYDSTQPLIVDPQLVYSTYLGGGDTDYLAGLGLDPSGNLYIGGDTASLNFPTANAYQSSPPASNNVFVTKLNANGSGLVYSTYIGGSSNDFCGGIAVDTNGNAYVTGSSDSLDFPTHNGAFTGKAGLHDAFVAKLSPAGNSLLYGSYLGGGYDDSGNGIAVDNSGNAYVTGDTYSIGTGNNSFPTTHGAYQGNNAGGQDAFVAKFDTTQSGSASLIYSTFLGGNSDDKAYDIAIDSSGNSYVVGRVASYPTYPAVPSSNFPLLNAFQSSFNQGNQDPLGGNMDGFLTKLNATGTGLLFSTFLGGEDNDTALGVALDNSGRVYVVGETTSTNFPTLNAAQPVIGGISTGFPAPDAFISVFQPAGTSLYYSTYLGGSDAESGFETYPFGIGVDKFGDIYVAGQTFSFDFPLTVGADDTNSFAAADSFVTKINPAVPGPSGIVYSTLLSGDSSIYGGGADNRATAIAVDAASGNFFIGGITSSTNFLTTNAYDATFNGGSYDTFVAKFTSPPDLSVAMIPSLEPVIVGSNLTYTIYINNNGRTTFTGVSNFVQLDASVPILSVSSSAGNWSTNGSTLIFNLGTMTNNASAIETITIGTSSPRILTNYDTLTSIETGAGIEPNTGNNNLTVLSTVRGIADVTLAASGAPNPVVITSNITYTVTLVNKGPWPATSVLMADVLPPDLAFVSATSNNLVNCVYDPSSGVVFCDCGTMTNKESLTITITAMALTNDITTNFLLVNAFELDLNTNNNSANLVTTINPLAELTIGQTGPSSVYAGNNATYTMSVTNLGPSTPTNVVVTDTWLPGASFVSATVSQGTFSQLNGVLTASLGTLASNGTATVSLTVKPLVAGTATNSSTVTSSAPDPQLSNNTALITTFVNPAADLGISQVASPTSTLVASNVTFTLSVTNRGPSTAPNVILNDALPAAFSIVSIQTPPGGSCVQTNGVLSCNFGSLPNAASATLSILTTAITDGRFTNSATVSSDVTDLNPNNTTNVAVTVSPNPSVPVLKITRSGANILLSWATNASGFSLQSRADLSPNSVWSPLTNVPVVVNLPASGGYQFVVTNTISTTNNYYRLVRTLPVLSLLKVGTKLVVSWPATAAPSGTLRSTTNLVNPIVWSTVTNNQVLIGSTYYVTNPLTASRALYRLFY